MTTNASWATAHSARHFRVTMIVFGSGGSARRIQRRFDVGRQETQHFDLGRCNNFKLLIEVISPTTSPNLVGTVRIA